MTDFWKVLAIAPTDDVKLIKRAYAAKLKQVRPDDDPQGFQHLREAYEWALEYGVKWFAYARDAEDFDDSESIDDSEALETRAPSIELSSQLVREPVNSDTAIESDVVPFVPSYRRKAEASSEAEVPEAKESPELAPAGVPEALSMPATPLLTPQTVRVASEFLPDLRSIDGFLRDFYQVAAQMQSQEQAERWLEAQPEWISLPFRRNLDAALEQHFGQMHWPWPAVLAVSKLLEWESIGAGRRDLMIVRRARLHARANLTPKPTLFSFFSKSATAYILLRPPIRAWRVLRPMLPITHWVNQLFSEVQSQGLAADEIFDVAQVNIEQALQAKVINGTNFVRMLADALFITAVIQLLSTFNGNDNTVLVLGLMAFVGLFAIYCLIRGVACLRLLRQSYFRLLWSYSLRARRTSDSKAIPPWSLLVPVLGGLGYIAFNLNQPLISLILAAGILHCMRAPIRWSWLPIAGISVTLTVASIYLWPTANQVLHALSAVAIGGLITSVIVWYRIRKQGISAHLQAEFASLLASDTGNQEAKPQNVSWIFWLLGFMILRAITAMG